MRRVKLDNKIKIIGKKEFHERKKQIHYYLVTRENEMLYAFSKGYTHRTYDLCKSGIRVNELITKKTRDTGVMNLVNYTNLMLPYLAEIYELPLAQ